MAEASDVLRGELLASLAATTYLFLHGYHDRQYHLERRCWVPVAEAFGE